MLEEPNLIPILKLISEAKVRGINLGKGNPNEYLRYLTKLGFLPPAKRLADPENPGQKPPKTVGAYPASVLNILEKISQLKKIGFSIPEIKTQLFKIQQSLTETQINEKTKSRFNFSLIFAFFLLFAVSMLLTTPLPEIAKQKVYQNIISPIKKDLKIPQVPEEKGEVAAVVSESTDDTVFDSLKHFGIDNGRLDITAQNLLRNPGFEANDLGIPKLWTYYNQSTEANTFVTQENFHTGKNGLKFKGSSTSPYLGIYQPEVITDWNKAYTLSAWVKALNTKNATIILNFWDQPNNKRVAGKKFPVTGTADWFRISTTIDNDTNWQGKRWFPLIEIYGLTAGTIYIDNVQLEESAGPTLYHTLNGALLGDGSITVDSSGNFFPTQDAVGDLGKSGGRWRKLQLFQASINEEGDASFAGSLSTGTVNSNLNPDATNTYDLGSTSLRWNNGFIGNLTVSSCTGCGGISSITVQEGDTNVDTAVTTLDFLAGDFDVTSSPSGEANIILASTLTTPTGVSGDWSVAGGDITSSATTFNLLNSTVTTLNIGGAATSLSLGASTGTITLNNATISAPNASTFNCADCINFDDLADSMTLDGTAGASSLSIGTDNTRGITITSDLSGGARSVDVLTISQANDAANNSTANLLQLTNSDTGSTAAVLEIDQSAGGHSINITRTHSFGICFGTSGTCSDTGILMPNLPTSNMIHLGQGGGVGVTTGIGIRTGVRQLTSGLILGHQTSDSVSGSISAFTGDIIRFAPSRTLIGANIDDTGNFLDLSRSNAVNIAGGTYTISGHLATLSQSFTQTAGTLAVTADVLNLSSNCSGACTYTGSTANILELNQQDGNAPGAVLNLLNSGTGADIIFNTSPILRMSDGGTMTWDDGTNTLMSIADAGTTGNLTVTGNLTGGSVVSSGTTTLDLGGTATAFGVCKATSTGTDNEAIVDCTGSDFAEYYETEAGVEPGDIVVTTDQYIQFASPNSNGGLSTMAVLSKSTQIYQPNLVGVVSTSPYQIAGDDPDLIAKAKNLKPVSLAGRALVKVSTEAGSIKAGDFITSSSTPGVGMKATKAGRVVGMALESFACPTSNDQGLTQEENQALNVSLSALDQSCQGKILVFVNPTFYLGQISESGELITNKSGDQGLTTNNANLEQTVADIEQSSTSSANLNNQPPITSHQSLITQIIEVLKSLGITIKQNFLAVGQAVIEKITLKEILIDNSKDAPDDKPIVGQAVILKGATEIEIENEKVNQNSRIFVTFRGEPVNIGWSIGKIEDSKSFTVKLSQSLSQDLIFDYLIIQTTQESKQVKSTNGKGLTTNAQTETINEQQIINNNVSPSTLSTKQENNQATESATIND